MNAAILGGRHLTTTASSDGDAGVQNPSSSRRFAHQRPTLPQPTTTTGAAAVGRAHVAAAVPEGARRAKVPITLASRASLNPMPRPELEDFG